MCGIVGYYGLNESKGRHAIEDMMKALKSRGPDQSGWALQTESGSAVNTMENH